MAFLDGDTSHSAENHVPALTVLIVSYHYSLSLPSWELMEDFSK